MNYFNLIKFLKVKNDEIKDFILNIKEPNFINKLIEKEMYFELINILQYLEIKYYKHNEIIIFDQLKEDFFIIPLKGSIDILFKKKLIEDKSTSILKTDKMLLNELKKKSGVYQFERFFNFKNIYDKKKFNFKYDFYKTFKEGRYFGNMLKNVDPELRNKKLCTIVSNNLNYINSNLKFKDEINWIKYDKFDYKYHDKVIIGIIHKKDFNQFENKFEEYEYSRKIKFIKNIFPQISMLKINILLNKLEKYKFKKNDIIFQSKNKIDYIYFIKSGKVLLKDKIIVKKNETITINVRLLSKNIIIGVNEILKNHNKYFFDGICQSEKCKLYGIEYNSFIKFIENYPKFISILKEKILDFKNYIKNKKNIIKIRKKSFKNLKFNQNKKDESNNNINLNTRIKKFQNILKKNNFLKDKNNVNKKQQIKIGNKNKIKSLDKNKLKNYNGKLKLNNKQLFKIKYLRTMRTKEKSTYYLSNKIKKSYNTFYSNKIDKSKSISIFNKFLPIKNYLTKINN